MNIKIKNILISIVCFLIYGIIFRLLPIFSEFEYLNYLICYIIMTIVLIFMLYILNKLDILKFETKNFLKGLIIGLGYIIIAIPSLISNIVFYISEGYSFLPIIKIICFILAILCGTGFCEELLFRGIVQNLMYDAFGKTTKKGIIISIIISGIMFGLFHIGNITISNIGTTVTQMFVTIGSGILYGAVYARCKSIATVMFLHGFWDMCVLTSSGFFGIGTTFSATTSTSWISVLFKGLSFLAMFVAWALFLLRKKKEEEYIEKS